MTCAEPCSTSALTVGAVKFEARIKELVADIPDLASMVEPLLVVRRVLREQVGLLTAGC